MAFDGVFNEKDTDGTRGKTDLIPKGFKINNPLVFPNWRKT